MAEVTLANGKKFPTAPDGTAGVWLPLSVEVQMGISNLPPDFKPGSADLRDVVPDDPATVSVLRLGRRLGGLDLTLKAKAAGFSLIRIKDKAGAPAGRIGAFCGVVNDHTDMDVDLIAKVLRGPDVSKHIDLQLMLYDQKGPFDQHSEANIRKHGTWACGKVVKDSGTATFGSMSPIFYEHPYHEPVRRVSARTDLKYTADTIGKVRDEIRSLLKRGTPARVGVVHWPVGMSPINGGVVAYYAGGHTVLIVGCNEAKTRFLYIDVIRGGSTMEYKGGIRGSLAPGKPCIYMGVLEAVYDGTRAVGVPKDRTPNLLRQDPNTSGSFSHAKGNYLEVVSGPILIKK